MKKATALITAAALVVLLIIVGRLYISEADFSLENPYWNGLNTMSSGADLHPLYAMSGLSNAGSNDTLLIVGPTVNYTKEESSSVASFMRRGGRVIILDDYGTANSLLYNISSPITLWQVPLCQDKDYFNKQSFPVIKNIVGSRETANVSALTFNHPVPLNVSGARILARTSAMGWVDSNDNSRLDNGERMGSYPVIASWDHGPGQLLVIGDPDIVGNSVIDQTDNRVFMRNVLNGVVWVDVSHGRGVTPLGAIYFAIRDNPVAQLFIVALIFLCGYAYVKRQKLIRIFSGLIVTNKDRNDKNG